MGWQRICARGTLQAEIGEGRSGSAGRRAPGARDLDHLQHVVASRLVFRSLVVHPLLLLALGSLFTIVARFAGGAGIPGVGHGVVADRGLSSASLSPPHRGARPPRSEHHGNTADLCRGVRRRLRGLTWCFSGYWPQGGLRPGRQALRGAMAHANGRVSGRQGSPGSRRRAFRHCEAVWARREAHGEAVSSRPALRH